ncbi:hypothetical protein SCLCIDRAFT_29772 [Scleroderma citrinum Foug A]|uniref:Uncharacterized protein n=1 Tax=Scleroderma citrinum Foug A TaxID=1036808 RepID=A0A0C2ZUN4_9AGAM|nr:hypothetical protein SCLCIDRAFT_29772 [Scleroderma citrinum Foug A]
MSNTATGFRGMPGTGAKEALSFSGCAGDLLDFFTQFEDLAHSCGLTSSQQCHAYDDADYDTFKARVIDEYPGAEKGMQFTYRDLECIILTYGESDISTKTELMEFSQQFRPVVTWLVKNNKLSE